MPLGLWSLVMRRYCCKLLPSTDNKANRTAWRAVLYSTRAPLCSRLWSVSRITMRHILLVGFMLCR